ncbi:hypothetical protein RVBP21_3510 [Pseudomonas phage BRkr]|nr:hypothetical protein RVBP21_3510 [Pseudomonas phage BRkr]
MFESLLAVLNKYDDTFPPGSQIPIAGSDYFSYFGGFKAGLPQPEAFSNLVGFTEGTLHTSETTWFKYKENNRLIYLPKTPFRRGAARSIIENHGLIDGKEIQIGRHKFLCRVMTGIDNPGASATGGGEYNRLVYSMVIPRQSGAAAFESFSTSDFGLASTGGANWVREVQTTGTDVGKGFYRGFNSISYVGREVAGSNMNNYGWRPILIWIDPDIIPSKGPGTESLIAGNDDIGYFGRVPSSELITASALATLVGLSEGTVLNEAPDWFKFSHRSTILYIPQKPLKNNMTWNSLASAGLNGRGKRITIGDNVYQCRLMYIGATDTGITNNAAPGREWRDLMYNVHGTVTGTKAWENLTNADLGVGGQGAGSYSWGQETGLVDGKTAYAGIGYSNMSQLNINVPTNTGAHMGWRPVLELIGKA